MQASFSILQSPWGSRLHSQAYCGLLSPSTSSRKHIRVHPQTAMAKHSSKAAPDHTGPMMRSISNITLRAHTDSQRGLVDLAPASETATAQATSHWPVYLYVPNIVGYLRLVLTATAWYMAVRGYVTLALTVFLASISLDFVDGVLARQLNQVSSFGAFLDVLVDNFTRGALWCMACPAGLGVIPVVLEMTAFVATHKGGGGAWKEGCFSNAPTWVQWLMANGFKTPQGTLVVAGLFGAPLWLWTRQVLPNHPVLSSPLLGAVFLLGRAMAGAVELWVINRHLAGLARDDAKAAHARM